MACRVNNKYDFFCLEEKQEEKYILAFFNHFLQRKLKLSTNLVSTNTQVITEYKEICIGNCGKKWASLKTIQCFSILYLMERVNMGSTTNGTGIRTGRTMRLFDSLKSCKKRTPWRTWWHRETSRWEGRVVSLWRHILNVVIGGKDNNIKALRFLSKVCLVTMVFSWSYNQDHTVGLRSFDIFYSRNLDCKVVKSDSNRTRSVKYRSKESMIPLITRYIFVSVILSLKSLNF